MWLPSNCVGCKKKNKKGNNLVQLHAKPNLTPRCCSQNIQQSCAQTAAFVYMLPRAGETENCLCNFIPTTTAKWEIRKCGFQRFSMHKAQRGPTRRQQLAAGWLASHGQAVGSDAGVLPRSNLCFVWGCQAGNQISVLLHYPRIHKLTNAAFETLF